MTLVGRDIFVRRVAAVGWCTLKGKPAMATMPRSSLPRNQSNRHGVHLSLCPLRRQLSDFWRSGAPRTVSQVNIEGFGQSCRLADLQSASLMIDRLCFSIRACGSVIIITVVYVLRLACSSEK